jgi:protein-disulfide isomerase
VRLCRVLPVFAAAAALLALAASAPAASAEDALTPEQKAAVEQLIRETIAKHPEIVLDALDKAQSRRDADAAAHEKEIIADARKELISDPASPVGGNPAGDVTIVEFFDYRCPYCKAIEPSLEALLKADGKLRIVYKEFPILGPASVYAARVALAAVPAGKYGDFHRAMMAVKGPIDEDVVRKTAEGVGLDMAKIEFDMESDAVSHAIAANMKLAQQLNVDGTPAFIIGDEMLPGPDGVAALREAIAKARAGG